MSLFDPIVRVQDVAHVLRSSHYLGPASRGFAWSDEFGVLILASPTSRNIPGHWLELTRWCLNGTKNGGSQQWKKVSAWLRASRPDVTTVISYSDPSVGHTGALYRACNWLWAPTWMRLRPPPTGAGRWTPEGPEGAVKDRWIYVLREDPRREYVLSLKDSACERRFPDAEYREPKFRRGVPVGGTGGGHYRPLPWQSTVRELAA